MQYLRLCQGPNAIAHKDVHRGERARLEQQDIQRATISEVSHMLALGDLLARRLIVAHSLAATGARLDPTDVAAHGTTDSGDISQTHCDLRHEAVFSRVVKVIGAVESPENIEVGGWGPSVATPEPSAAVGNTKEGARHVHSLDECAVNGGMEIVVCIGHQYTGDGSPTDEPTGIVGAIQHFVDIHGGDALDWDFRIGPKFGIDEIDLHVTRRRDDHVRVRLADGSARVLILELAREELVERFVPEPSRVTYVVAFVEVLIRRHVHGGVLR